MSNSNSLQLLKNYIQNLSNINYSLINNKVTVEINDCYQIITEIFNQIKRKL